MVARLSALRSRLREGVLAYAGVRYGQEPSDSHFWHSPIFPKEVHFFHHLTLRAASIAKSRSAIHATVFEIIEFQHLHF